jgi:hypothetical protein
MRLCYECGVLSSLSSFCHVESGGSLSQEPSLSTFQLKQMLAEFSRTSGRSGRNGGCHSATNNGDGNDGQVTSQHLHVSQRAANS